MNMIMKKPFEFVSALTLILWGSWVSAPWFNSFQVSNVFNMMEKVAPEFVWGAFVLLLGIIKVVILHTKYIKLRIAISILVMFTFSLLTTFYALGNWMSTAAPMYLSFTVISWFSYMEILYDKKFPPMKGG